MPSVAKDMLESFRSSLVNESLTSCSRWAAKRRVMGEPFPGPYSWKYHPWVREMHDSKASFNYAMKAAQLGITEVGINRTFYALDQKKRDVLYVLPTALNASDFSKTRFSVALKHSPYLASIFTDTNTVNLKQAGKTTLYIRGSRGDSNLKSIPVSELILDEVDEMDESQIWLALERLSGQRHKCVWGISTPTIPKHGIHKLFLTSTQEHFVFKCPACSRWTELKWPDCIEIVGETLYDRRCHESFLKCKECKNRLEHNDKPTWLSTGEWKVTAPNNNPDVRGFYVNQLYSFTVTPGELVVAYFRGMGDEAACTEFNNSKLGLPYVGDGAQVTDDMLDQSLEKSKHTTNDARPKIGGQRLITMGIDQGKWSYWVVCEWLIDKLSRDINIVATCKVLAFGKFFEDDWGQLDVLMREWQVLAAVIDADPQINEASAFVRKYRKHAYLCRYRRGKTAKEISLTDYSDDVKLATVDRTSWLTASLGRFRTQRILLPRDVSLEFREHIQSLVRTYEKDENNNPVAVYKDTGPDHFAHALNYAEIALPLAASVTTGSDVETFL